MGIAKVIMGLEGIAMIVCWFCGTGLAQMSNGSATGVESKQTTRTTAYAAKEQVLEALHVKAIIEKPSVSIMPKRLDPPLGEVEFISRSFDRELETVPQEIVNFALGQNQVREIRELKKILAKNRKLLYISSRVRKESPKLSRR